MSTQRELQRELLARNPHYSIGQAKAVAKKMIYIEENGFFEQLRNLGLTSDPTAREAVRNIEDAEREKKKNGLEAQSAKICFEAVRTKVSERV